MTARLSFGDVYRGLFYEATGAKETGEGTLSSSSQSCQIYIGN